MLKPVTCGWFEVSWILGIQSCETLRRDVGMVSNYSQTIRAAVFAEQAGGAWVGPDVAKKITMPGLTWPTITPSQCRDGKREIQMLEGWTTWKDCWYMGMAQKHRPKNWLFSLELKITKFLGLLYPILSHGSNPQFPLSQLLARSRMLCDGLRTQYARRPSCGQQEWLVLNGFEFDLNGLFAPSIGVLQQYPSATKIWGTLHRPGPCWSSPACRWSTGWGVGWWKATTFSQRNLKRWWCLYAKSSGHECLIREFPRTNG